MRMFLFMLRLLNLEIDIITIDAGKIPNARTANKGPEEEYCGPIVPSTDDGSDMSAVMIGAVKLSPILMAPVEKSVFDSEDAGITIFAMLEAKLPATMLIIRQI